jgi:hypothetical protein
VREESDAICFGAPYGIVSRFRPTEIELGLPPPPLPRGLGKQVHKTCAQEDCNTSSFLQQSCSDLCYRLCNSRVRAHIEESCTASRTCSSASGSGPPPYKPTEARAHPAPALRRTRTWPCAHVHEQPSRSHCHLWHTRRSSSLGLPRDLSQSCRRPTHVDARPGGTIMSTRPIARRWETCYGMCVGGRAASRPCEGSQPSVRGAGLLAGRAVKGVS